MKKQKTYLRRKPNKILFLILSAIFALGVVGAGFSAWAFDSELRSEALSVDVLITESAVDGSWMKLDVPSFAVFDEGVNGGLHNTRTGISFYKKGVNTQLHPEASSASNENSGENSEYETEVNLDTNVSMEFHFRTGYNFEYIKNNLTFGFRITLTGGMENYIIPTSRYTNLSEIPASASFGGVFDRTNDFKNLLEFSELEFWGESNLIYLYGKDHEPTTDENGNVIRGDDEENITGLIFRMTTLDLSEFFTYVDGVRPTGDSGYDKYGALKEFAKDLKNSCIHFEIMQSRVSFSTENSEGGTI